MWEVGLQGQGPRSSPPCKSSRVSILHLYPSFCAAGAPPSPQGCAEPPLSGPGCLPSPSCSGLGQDPSLGLHQEQMWSHVLSSLNRNSLVCPSPCLPATVTERRAPKHVRDPPCSSMFASLPHSVLLSRFNLESWFSVSFSISY